jgi:hypothetical protein
MRTALGNNQIAAINTENDPIFIVYLNAPKPAQTALKRFRLAYPVIAVALNVP